MGLERSREVARRLALGKPAPLVVTVTGTNGKGSTCAFLASLLREQGLRVGLYSSPHLLRYNERVVVDGREAGDAELCQAFAAIEAVRGEISLLISRWVRWLPSGCSSAPGWMRWCSKSGLAGGWMR